MPTLTLSPGFDMSYRVDDFTDPWSTPETAVFVHGLAESSEAWRAWVPHFARQYRVIRPDQCGFGSSTPLPADFKWSLDSPADDLATFARKMKLPRFHLVSAKLGGTIAMRFAAKYPEMVKSLSVVSSPVSLKQSLGNKIPALAAQVKSEGVRSWASSSMHDRMGDDMSPEAMEYWADMMGATAASSILSITKTLAEADVTADLERIQCPTLVITTTGSGLGSVEQVKTWQSRIPNSELLVLDSGAYHIAASRPDQCATQIKGFMDRVDNK